MARKLRRRIRTFTNRIVANRPAERNPVLLTAGAASFTRVLGCAPQVIARVRFPSGSTGSTHRPCPCTAIVTPDGLLLGAHQPRRAPRATGLSLDSAFSIEPNQPDGCRLRHRSRPRGFSTKELVCGGMRSLTKRA